MKKRKLGRQGLEVSSIGLGCMGMSYAYGKADEKESLRTLERAIEYGLDFWDTAELYGPFKNEELLSRFVRTKRKQLIIGTKFGWRYSKGGKRLGLDGSPENMRRAVEGSLRRLGTDYIDLYYQHRLDPKTPVEETMAGLALLVKEGKVRYLGLSAVDPLTIKKAHAIHPLTAVQSEYSFCERGLQNEILPVLRGLGIGLVAYSPLGRGLLTGKIRRVQDLPVRDLRRRFPRFFAKNLAANLELVDALEKFAATKSVTVAQLVLAWILKQGEDVVPIPGTANRVHLEENIKAIDLKLFKDEFAAMNAIFNRHPIKGARLPEGVLGPLMSGIKNILRLVR